MEWSGKAARRHDGRAPSGLDEEEFPVEFDPIHYSQAPVEIQQIDAAAQQHMLAIVDGFRDLFAAGRHRVGGGTAAQIGTRFEQIDLVAGAA